MSTVYHCDKQNRLDRVRAHATLNGIDWLQVLDGEAPPGTARQGTLLVHFLKPLSAPLSADDVVIEAPAGAAAVAIAWVGMAADAAALAALGVITAAESAFLSALADVANVLVVRCRAPGDFSSYTLRIVPAANSVALPADIDVRLAAIDFSFKVECPSPFDCRVDTAAPPRTASAPVIDYLAKDYASFRRLMLDRLAVTMPAWRDRSAADLGVVLTELMAYVGDHLSYAQDAVATEAYLGTARRRASVRRHARLLDYRVHDGTNARAWVHVRVGSATMTLPQGSVMRTAGSDALVFETMHDVDLHPSHNEIAFYTWSDEECCLSAGATSATLLDAEPATAPLRLEPGDVLVFEEVIGPATGLSVDADLARRHAVRLIEVAASTADPLTGQHVVEIVWHADDALPFDLCLSARIEAGDGSFGVRATSCVRGNIVLVDEGASVHDEKLEPAVVTADRYRPRLQRRSVVHAEIHDHEAMKTEGAAAALRQDPRAAVPAATFLRDGDESWSPRADLLASDRTAPHFVVEPEEDGRAYVRFGNDQLGKAPSPGREFLASYRVGGGPAGNVGIGAISVIDKAGIVAVRNPMAAVGGTEPESLDEVRIAAPQAFRTQERAVTERDYATMVERLPGVQRAAARYRWTGSWLTVFLTIDRKGGLPVRSDAEFMARVQAHLERYRMAGFDVEVRDPVFVPLDIEIHVCVAAGYFRSHVQQSLLVELGNATLADGRRGFFHPDAFTFGQAVYLSQIYRRAMAIDGVASVEVTRFQRYGKVADDELERGLLAVADLEVVRLDNDPSLPENGLLNLKMAGGL
ncbi:MAG: putative baseplate assembly protein [Planctomycetes bacterium]|nr:putative baseplate assembly protein [Planctomycetota bacterium]